MSDIVTKDLSDENDKSIKENCNDIEKVFEKRKTTDTDLKLENSQIMYKLFIFLCCENHLSQHATRYICNHNVLPVQLVQIIEEAEDLQTCTYTVEILYKLLTYNDADRTTIKKNLSSPTNFSQLLESMYSVHARFCENTEYKEVLPDMHTKLLHMIVIIYEVKKCRKYITSASENTVRFIGQLLTVYYKNRELVIYLLTVLKVLCFKKNNSELLASKRFYDSLCYSCKLTQKIFTVALIFKLMSRNTSALNCMSRNEKVFNLILDLANYSGKKSVNKRTLMTTLYRLTKTAQGLKILLNEEYFNKLFNYFLKNEKPDIFNHRMGTIKAYTILNRCATKIVVPSAQLNMDLHLPEDVIKYHEDSSSEESDRDNDDSEEESLEVEEIDYDSDEFVVDADTDLVNIDTIRRFSIAQENISSDSLSKMNIFFKELLLNAEDNNNCFKLKIFEELEEIDKKNRGKEVNSWQSIIEDNVYRLEDMNNHAYPDAIMLEAQSDDHYLNPITNYFSVEQLAHKLKCARGTAENDYNSTIVYNLDDLYDEYTNPPIVPHPSTFMSSRDFNQVNTVEDEENTLIFESRFECGNLRSVKQIEKFEYELLVSPDTNGNGGHQWFYFQVNNMIPEITYTFNIINFIKVNSQYNYGMQPVLFSLKDYLLNKIGWRRTGEKIIYYGSNYYADENSTKQYRTLSFSIVFPHANDYVYLAYHYPYTYTRLMTILFPIANCTPKGIYTRIDKLCNTVNCTNEVPLLTVTAAWDHPKSLGIPFDKRPVIFITARVHPGETNSSWIMEGIIKFLLNETDEQAVKVREYFIFKVIPMLNPEGVIYGNTRSGLTGVDLNRCWTKPNQITCPEIYYTKKLVEYVKKELKQPIAAYIDIHGHSRKKFFFFYGCNPKMSWNKKDRKSGDCSKILKLLPQMVQVLNPHIRLSFCRYKIQKKRESTSRVVMWREFGIQKAYTLECSYCSGDNNQVLLPRRSSDILWECLKSRLYTTRSRTLHELKNRRREGIEHTDNALMQRVMQNVRKRVSQCILYNGDHSKNVI